MTATFILQSDGLTYFVTEPTSDTQLNALKSWLDQKVGGMKLNNKNN